MTEKRFEVVMNEFDEVEYIMDKEMMEDRDFAEFMDFVEDVCKENEQLKQIILFANELIRTQHITQHDYWKFRTLCKNNGVDLE
jgi:hypothetical protein